MTSLLPLVRAAAIRPFLSWLKDHGRAVDECLLENGLSPACFTDPSLPIPLLSCIRLVRDVSRREGPDFPLRAMRHCGPEGLGMIGRVQATARTPREACLKIVRAHVHLSSHEMLTFASEPLQGTLRHVFRVPVDHESLFYMQQAQVAAMLALFGTRPAAPVLSRLQMVPHPDLGFAPLAGHVDVPVEPSATRALIAVLPGAVLDRPYPRRLSAAGEAGVEMGAGLRGDGTLAGSIRAVLPQLMSGGGEPSLAEIAALSFMSPRTLQRRLGEEKTRLSILIEQERARQALDMLRGTTLPIRNVAVELGYGSPASFTRAVRRWTARTPTSLRGS
ncbi:helix-turn-helix domain-containing protein [Aquabacter sp. L1I39]|uniref:AraC family transcriptional regulator n=1 Tax=Aquabacter sp. L1I39 TaxID=2820278 RepID=UPI001ADCAD74|nr:AraC family transcriptional regulator [Aquabacter sp. L1I39]QTL05643.1 helix-turn-helix domain-containing protein [Aquabacter sp. L1I39]